MKRPRRIFVVSMDGALMFQSGDYNRATRLARDLATENGAAVEVRDHEGVCYTVDAHGQTQTLRSVRD